MVLSDENVFDISERRSDFHGGLWITIMTKTDSMTKSGSATQTLTDSPAESGESRPSGENIFIFVVLGVFAALLALITSKHEMFLDEAQAWLIARDSRSFMDLIHTLHYEAHPAVWYLLLLIPAHVTPSVVAMQCVNYCLAIVMAWLVLSWRNLPLMLRILLVFSLTIFFTMGVLARSYMLGGVLLVGAARCLLASNPRHWLAMALLALAINTHFFAISVALCIFMWLYWLAPEPGLETAIRRLSETKFRISSMVMGVALLCCYLTVRPAADIANHYPIEGAGFIDYLVVATGRVWHYFVPFSWGLSGVSNGRSLLTIAAVADALMTVAIWFVAISVLPGKRSRWFMASASLCWLLMVVATVHVPLETHCAYLVIAYLIALNMNTRKTDQQSWLPAYVAQPVLLTMLTMQVALCLDYGMMEWQKPFSASKTTAEWLRSAGLSRRPLVVQQEIIAPVLVAYLGVKSVYIPGCSCNHSYAVYRQGWDRNRLISADEIDALQQRYGLSPVLISHKELASSDLERLGLRLLYTSPRGWAWNSEDVYVYGDPGESSRTDLGVN
jgi:hypothetical protein